MVAITVIVKGWMESLLPAFVFGKVDLLWAPHELHLLRLAWNSNQNHIPETETRVNRVGHLDVL